MLLNMTTVPLNNWGFTHKVKKTIATETWPLFCTLTVKPDGFFFKIYKDTRNKGY